MGEAALKPIKFFVYCFKSSDLYPKFPGQIGPLALCCRLSALAAFLSAQGPVDYTAFRCFCHFSGWVELKTLSTVGGAVSQVPFLGGRVMGHSRVLSVSQTDSLFGRGWELP